MELALICILIAAIAYWVWRYRKNQQSKRENTLYFRTKLNEVETALGDFDPQQTLLKTEEIDTIQKFLAFRIYAENLRSEYNQKFIQDELKTNTIVGKVKNVNKDLFLKP